MKHPGDSRSNHQYYCSSMRFVHSCISCFCCCYYHASNIKFYRPRLMMMRRRWWTVHAALMNVQAHHHLAPAVPAFLVGNWHFPSSTRNGNRQVWRPTSSATSAEQQQQHPHRRRRRRNNNLLDVAETATSDNIPNFEPMLTPYTINQSVCPATHTTRLEQLVTKHIHTLPQYWKNKPSASHNEEAFEYALEFVIRFGQQQQQQPQPPPPLWNKLSSSSSKYENESERFEVSAFEGGSVSSSSSSLTFKSQSSLQRTNVILDIGSRRIY